MNDTNKHTFVVCAYGESPYLEDCICSIKNQSVCSNIIISTSTDIDFIRNVADKYGLPLFVSGNEPELAGDWNYGYSLAQTEYITLAHQDDIYNKDYLKEALLALDSNKKPLIYFSNYYEIRGRNNVYTDRNLVIKKVLLSPISIFKNNKFVRRRILSLGNPICCPSVTYVRANLPTQLFESNFKSNTDWEAWEKISKYDGQFVYNNKPLMGHRVHENSTTTEIINSHLRTQEDLLMLRKFWPSPIAKLINLFYKKAEKSNHV